MGKDIRTGEVEAVEIGNQIPGQMSVQDVPGVVPEAGTTVVDGKVIDKATGEVVATRYHYFPKADSLSVNTLTSIVDYIKGKPEELRESMILHVISPTEVRLYSGLVDERNREELMRADAIVNEFQFDRYYDQERFLIELQANFIESDDLTVLKQVAGNIESGTTANYDDDGVRKPRSRAGLQIRRM